MTLRRPAVLLLVAACGDDASLASDAATGGDGALGAGWTTGAPVGQGTLQETAAVGVDGKIYVIGGFDNDEGIVARTQIYDTTTNTWSDGPALPMPLHHATAATDGTTIYVAGALTGLNFAAVGNVYSLAPATETQWQARAPMTAGRERGAAVAGVIGGKLYIAGGFRSGGASALVDVYDPDGDSWTELSPLPTASDHGCGGALDGQLVVAAGRIGSMLRPEVYAYDPSGTSWATRAPMPTPRAGMGCGVISNVLYTTGGEGNRMLPSGVFANVEAYSIASNSWTQLAPMPNPKHGVAGAVWNGALYLCGGADQEGFGAIDATDIFRP